MEDSSLLKPQLLLSKEFKGPRGLRIHNDKLYIADRTARVCYVTSADLTAIQPEILQATTVKIPDYYREPYFVFPGVDGVVYATEHLNGCIFAYIGDAPTVLAGKPGYGGGGTTTANARFMNPRGGCFAFDTGTVWIADTANDQIRCLEADGTVKTIGSGSSKSQDGPFESTKTSFRRPSDICIKDDGLLYVAENYTVRVMNPANKTVSTLAGTPNEAGFTDGPSHVSKFGVLWSIAAIDDYLVVTDTTNKKIRVIDLQGYVTTLHMPMVPDLFGIAVTPHGHVLYTQLEGTTIGFLPFAMEDVLIQSITLESVVEFTDTPTTSICGEPLPTPLLALAYPSLINTPSDSDLFNDINGDPALIKLFTNYLLSNDSRLLKDRKESSKVLKTLLKLGLPIPRLDGSSGPVDRVPHLQQRLMSLYWTTVAPSASNVISKDIPEGVTLLAPTVAEQVKPNFVIQSASGTSYPCHDWVLFSRWPFFKNMVLTGMIETSSKRAELDEMEDGALEALLRFLYTNDLSPLSDDGISIDLLSHAQRYQLATLSTPAEPTTPAFRQLLSRCRRIFDLPKIDPQRTRRINELVVDFGTAYHQSRPATDDDS